VISPALPSQLLEIEAKTGTLNPEGFELGFLRRRRMRRKTITAKEVSFAGSTGNPNRHQHSSVNFLLSLFSLLSLSLSLLSLPLNIFLCARLSPTFD